LTYDDFNEFCRALPATVHVVQWGGAQVWKVGGKVFAIGGWAEDEPAFTFKIDDVPDGTYQIEAWHEKMDAQAESVTLADGEAGGGDFTFSR